MKNDMISRQAAINVVRIAKGKGEAHRMLIQLPPAQPKDECEYWDSESSFCALHRPSAQPTLYGYDIKHLAFVASIMAKEGMSPEEAVTTFRDINRVIEIMLEDMKEMQENVLKQALKKPCEGEQECSTN